jgi:hypothetical protein
MGRVSQFVSLIKRTLDRQQRGVLRLPVIMPIGATRALGEGFFLPQVSGLGALLKEMQSDSLPTDTFQCTPLTTQKEEYLDTYFRNYGFEPGNPNKHYYRTSQTINPGFKADDINTWQCLHVQRSASYRADRPNSKATQMYNARTPNMTTTVTKSNAYLHPPSASSSPAKRSSRRTMMASASLVNSMKTMTLNSPQLPMHHAPVTAPPLPPPQSQIVPAVKVDIIQIQLMQFLKEMELVDKLDLAAQIVIDGVIHKITDYPNLVFQSRSTERQTELKTKYPALTTLFDKIEPNGFNPFFVRSST